MQASAQNAFHAYTYVHIRTYRSVISNSVLTLVSSFSIPFTLAERNVKLKRESMMGEDGNLIGLFIWILCL